MCLWSFLIFALLMGRLDHPESKVASQPMGLVVRVGRPAFYHRSDWPRGGSIVAMAHAGMNKAGSVSVARRRGMCDAFKAMLVKMIARTRAGSLSDAGQVWFRPCIASRFRRRKCEPYSEPREPIESKLNDRGSLLRHVNAGFGLKVGPNDAANFRGLYEGLVAGIERFRSWRRRFFRCTWGSCAQFQLLKSVFAPWSARHRARLLMTAPGVQPIVALILDVSAIDDPSLFLHVVTHGRGPFRPHSGRYESGETDVTGRISKIGWSHCAHPAPSAAAHTIVTRPVKGSAMKSWAESSELSRTKKAEVAQQGNLPSSSTECGPMHGPSSLKRQSSTIRTAA